MRPQRVEELAVNVTIPADRDSVGIDPGAAVTGHGALTMVSLTQPPRGARVTVVDGGLVVARVAGFLGTVRFAYVVVGEDGTQVTVTVTVEVLAASEGAGGTDDGGSPTLTSGSALPHTGADVGFLALAGVLLLVLGIAAVRLGSSGDLRPRASGGVGPRRLALLRVTGRSRRRRG